MIKIKPKKTDSFFDNNWSANVKLFIIV
jgi:hypothetical protein